MKYLRLLPAVLLFAVFVPLAFSQDSMMTLNDKELGKHERPLVVFNHEDHANKIDCLQCHHDFDAYMNNRGGEGQPCGTCHGPQATKDTKSLEDAFHQQCKVCHEQMRALGRPTGPVICSGCHVKK